MTTGLTSDLLNIYQTAALLKVSVPTVYRWSAGGVMPGPLKFGGRLRWRKSALEQWAADGFPSQAAEAKKCGRKACA